MFFEFYGIQKKMLLKYLNVIVAAGVVCNQELILPVYLVSLRYICVFRGFARIPMDISIILPCSFGLWHWMTDWYFLYACLQTGRIMVWWCPSGSPSVRPTLRPSVCPSDSPSVRSGLRPPIFRTFFLHALIYWAEILHMTLFWCTTDQVRLSSLCVNFWRSYASLWT